MELRVNCPIAEPFRNVGYKLDLLDACRAILAAGQRLADGHDRTRWHAAKDSRTGLNAGRDVYIRQIVGVIENDRQLVDNKRQPAGYIRERLDIANLQIEPRARL